MAKKKSQILGRWRTTSMTEWDQDFVDEEVPGCFEFTKDGHGDFQFGYVRCDILDGMISLTNVADCTTLMPSQAG